MEIITGFTGAKHVRSEQDRDINIGTFGEESYVLQTGMKMEAEVSSNNEIKIRDGVIMHQGCAASIKKNTYDTVTIVNGSQGMKRIDLIVARYQRNQDDGKEFMRFMAIQGTPAESNPAVPSHITGDIQSGDAVADMPMYKIIIDGLNITEVQKVFSEAPNIAELNRNFSNALGMLSNIKGIYVGSKISACNQTYALLHDNASLTKILGKAPTTNNFVCMVMNGDANAAQTSYYSPQYYSGDGLYVYVYPNVTGNIRINYMIFAIE